jgi:hypothetical protein
MTEKLVRDKAIAVSDYSRRLLLLIIIRLLLSLTIIYLLLLFPSFLFNSLIILPLMMRGPLFHSYAHLTFGPSA